MRDIICRLFGHKWRYQYLFSIIDTLVYGWECQRCKKRRH
ncbi:DUF1660 family phage protein [Brevibacillus brevis]|nr:DUF1660 family phage protein [Brevibacillus brevis]